MTDALGTAMAGAFGFPACGSDDRRASRIRRVRGACRLVEVADRGAATRREYGFRAPAA